MQSIQTQELTLERVNEAVVTIVNVLGTPENDLHLHALSAFRNGDYQTVKRLTIFHIVSGERLIIEKRMRQVIG